MHKGSRIYVPSRALGYVSNERPLIVRYIQRRKEYLIVTCVGRSFHTYGCSHFTLLSTSGLHPSDITCMTADAFLVFTAADNTIFAWRRGRELKHTYRGHEKPIHLMLPFGPLLLSVDRDNVLKMWDIKTEALHSELSFDSSTFQVSAILHPSTYINKILVGSEQGQMQLWNINTMKLLYTFKGWLKPIKVLEQAPAQDVVAIGLTDGTIILHNLKYDETVVEFQQDWGCVSSISFRTDSKPMMITGSMNGNIVYWDLEERKCIGQLENAHDGAVHGLQCLSGEPLLLTSSNDNTLKLWIFDMPDGGARLLRIREGHSAPPSFIRFHGSLGQNLLSAGADSTLRIFNTVTETFNKSLGKASSNRKATKKKHRTAYDPLILPPIMEFTTEVTREKEWDNIAALHLDKLAVTTWSYDKLKMGELQLFHDRFRDTNKSHKYSKVYATCLCLTNCGNFVLIGYNSGHLDRFNIQSGFHRGTYGSDTAHMSAVRGVATDNLNLFTISAGGDGIIKFWHFKNKTDKEIYTLDLKESISFVRSHSESSMLCVVLEEFSICIVDIDTRSVVRKFKGHSASITDAAFSPDTRWIITSSMDCTIRTWDIPSANLIDQFRVESPCTSLTMSPVGEFLATTHVDYLGVFLWANKSLYTHVSLTAIDSEKECHLVDLPNTVTAVTELDVEEQDDNDDKFVSPEQINKQLITLSKLSTSRWQNLLNLDIIKQRNKPKEAPKVLKTDLFFLPTIPSLNMTFDLNKEKSDSGIHRTLNSEVIHNLTPFGKLLEESIESNIFDSVIEGIKNMGPSRIDFEINSLSQIGNATEGIMLQFLKMIDFMYSTNKDFELAQAYLGLFLKVHADIISKSELLRNYLNTITKSQSKRWKILENQFFYNISIVQNLRNLSG
ncbi:WD repeat-containing protein 36 [Ctenocephalides felis]|uniref:WD repeat-containing protein 36 n=1 Tax=Ctenocephalides felis TaxID=7515 RepID=UPI000E6E4187|nr:WD repeat-containing protein 36 [Ctenocephalides felis]